MFSIKKTIGLILFAAPGLVTAGACKVSNLKPVTFPAEYKTEGSANDIIDAPACAAFRDWTISDERPDKNVAGIRTIQDKDTQSEILITGDVESWFRAGVSRGLIQAHFQQDPSARLDLRMKLAELRLEEVAYRNSTYEGRVIIDVELTQPGSGSTVWTHRCDGVAQNYGRPGNPENYQETINHALDRAIADAVNNPDLRQRMCDASAQAGGVPLDSP